MSEKFKRVAGKDGKVTIPRELRIAIGLALNEYVSFELISEDTILVRREQVKERTEDRTDMPSLQELLEGLTDSQRIAAQCYLSVLCSSQGSHGGRDCV